MRTAAIANRAELSKCHMDSVLSSVLSVLVKSFVNSNIYSITTHGAGKNRSRMVFSTEQRSEKLSDLIDFICEFSDFLLEFWL